MTKEKSQNDERINTINNTFENNEWANKATTIRPKDIKIGLRSILSWNPNKDETEEIFRGSVPLSKRKKGYKINPSANEEAKVQSLALMGSNSDYYSAVGGSETMDIYAFDYWQYLDSLVFWDGLVPSPDVIDSAHQNGVPVFGTLFFNWSTSEKDRENVRYFLQKDEKDNYIVAEKLVDIAKYYRFDGYFINQESSMPAGEAYGEKFRSFLLYLKRYANEVDYPIHLSWYDSMDNDGSRVHHDAVNSSNDLYVEPNTKDAINPTDEFFMNFNWETSKVDSTINHMGSIERSPYDAYAGLELQAGGYYHTNQKKHAFFDENGQAKLSLGLFIPDTVLGIADNGEDYHLEADKFWTGFGGNPTRERDEHEWSGISRYVVDKTPIINSQFNTYFNTGHGKHWFVNGEISRDKSWNSRGVQDVMPTWRWWVENTDASIKGRYDFNDAFNGGTSVTFEGNLEQKGQSDVMLYSTNFTVEKQTKMKIVSKDNHPLHLQIGLSTEPNYSNDSFRYYDLNHSSDWKSQFVDLADLVGQSIYAVKLRLHSDHTVTNYKLNIGQLFFGSDETPISKPSDVDVLEKLFFNAQEAEAMIKVSPVVGAKQYEVYQKIDDRWEFLHASRSPILYVPSISRTSNAKGKTQELKMVALGENGIHSKPYLFNFDWGMKVTDTTLPIENPEHIMIDADVTSYIEPGNTENPENILTGTINNNSDKWYSSNKKGKVAIKLPEIRTVKHWVVEHAGAGGEAIDDGSMNTKDFNLEYKDLETEEWKIGKEICSSNEHVTDVILDEPIIAQEWRLNIITADNGSPWGGIRIYNWKMYQSYNTESQNLPMATTKAVNTIDTNYSVVLSNGMPDSTVYLFGDNTTQNNIAEGKVDTKGDVIFHNLTLEGLSGYLYYRAQQPNLELSNTLAIPYEKSKRTVQKVDLLNSEIIEVNQTQSLDLSTIYLIITYSDNTEEVVRLNNILVDLAEYSENQYGQQFLPISYAGIKSESPLVVNNERLDFDKKTVSSIEMTKKPKQRYLRSETLDLSEGMVTIYYDDGDNFEVPLTDDSFFTISEFNEKQIGQQIITITHRDRELTFNVIVDEESINFQRLDQLTSQAEALEYQENYDKLSCDEKQIVKDFIALGHEKKVEETITQEEVDQIVAVNTERLQKFLN